MKKAFDEGWGGVICKTLSLDSTKVNCLQKSSISAFNAHAICSACYMLHGWCSMTRMSCQSPSTICMLLLGPVQVVNVTPRYAKLRDSAGKVFG